MKVRLSNNPTMKDKLTFIKAGLKPGDYGDVICEKTIVNVSTKYGNIWVDADSLDYQKETVSGIDIDRLKSMLGMI